MAQSSTQPRTERKFHYAWIIALVGFIIYWFVICIVSNCVGMFVYPESAQELADQFTETFSN